MDDQFNVRTDDDLFSDDFEPFPPAQTIATPLLPVSVAPQSGAAGRMSPDVVTSTSTTSTSGTLIAPIVVQDTTTPSSSETKTTTTTATNTQPQQQSKPAPRGGLAGSRFAPKNMDARNPEAAVAPVKNGRKGQKKKLKQQDEGGNGGWGTNDGDGGVGQADAGWADDGGDSGGVGKANTGWGNDDANTGAGQPQDGSDCANSDGGCGERHFAPRDQRGGRGRGGRGRGRGRDLFEGRGGQRNGGRDNSNEGSSGWGAGDGDSVDGWGHDDGDKGAGQPQTGSDWANGGGGNSERQLSPREQRGGRGRGSRGRGRGGGGGSCEGRRDRDDGGWGNSNEGSGWGSGDGDNGAAQSNVGWGNDDADTGIGQATTGWGNKDPDSDAGKPQTGGDWSTPKDTQSPPTEVEEPTTTPPAPRSAVSKKFDLTTRLASGGLARPKLSEAELTLKMAEMRVVNAQRSRRHQAAEQDSHAHAAALARDIEQQARRNAEDAAKLRKQRALVEENRKRQEDDRKKLDAERERNRARKLKVMESKADDGGGFGGRSWDTGKGDGNLLGGGRTGSGGFRRRTGLAGSRWAATTGEVVPEAERGVAPREQRGGRGRGGSGRGRGKGRGFFEGGGDGDRQSQDGGNSTKDDGVWGNSNHRPGTTWGADDGDNGAGQPNPGRGDGDRVNNNKDDGGWGGSGDGDNGTGKANASWGDSAGDTGAGQPQTGGDWINGDAVNTAAPERQFAPRERSSRGRGGRGRARGRSRGKDLFEGRSDLGGWSNEDKDKVPALLTTAPGPGSAPKKDGWKKKPSPKNLKSETDFPALPGSAKPVADKTLEKKEDKPAQSSMASVAKGFAPFSPLSPLGKWDDEVEAHEAGKMGW